LTLATPPRRLAVLPKRPEIKKREQAKTEPDLFNETEQTGSATAAATRAVPEAIAAGYKGPGADSPFLFSCSLWEAFNVGQYLHSRGSTTFPSAKA
jgi:hypothetical protein